MHDIVVICLAIINYEIQQIQGCILIDKLVDRQKSKVFHIFKRNYSRNNSFNCAICT